MSEKTNYQTISGFAESHGVDRNAVTAYVRRHQADFDGHVFREPGGKQLLADADAIRLLDEKYPLQVHNEIIAADDSRIIELQQEKIDLQKQLLDLQNKLLQAKDLITSQQIKLTEASGMQKMLEDRSQTIANQQDRIKSLEAKDSLSERKLQDFSKKLDNSEAETKELQDKLVRLKNRSLWQRIRNTDV